MDLEEEKILIDKSKSNPEAFGVLYDFFYPKIFGYVFRRVKYYEVARDITSESFLKAFKKIHSFKWRGVSISSWLYKIATNEIRQYLRKQKYDTYNIHDLFGDEFQFHTHINIEETIKAKIEYELKLHKDFQQVQQLLKSLPIKYQEVIALKYFENKSIKEISELLSKKEGTVKSLLSRGLERMRNLL